VPGLKLGRAKSPGACLLHQHQCMLPSCLLRAPGIVALPNPWRALVLRSVCARDKAPPLTMASPTKVRGGG
jgi:hypothetical protein